MAMLFRVEYISTFYDDVIHFESILADYPQKAKRIFQKLDKILLDLAKHPMMYPIYEYFPDFRRITIEDYLVFYTVNEKDNIIEIHRLLYGRMDIPKQISEN